MTIKEIAKESGYGVGTVSRVLNNNPNVSEAAKKAVMDVVQKYNYTPNANAKHLKQQSGFGIALIVKGTQNMLFTAMEEKIQAGIEKRGYVCTIYYIDQDANEIEQAAHICLERKPYGIMFLGSNIRNINSSVEDLGVPCLLVTNSALELGVKNLSSVTVDDAAAAACMIDYLYKKGHRHIGIIGGKPELSRPTYLRLAGAQSAMRRNGMEFDPDRDYSYARFSMQGGYRATQELLDKNPSVTAIFAMSDLMAVGAVRALYDRGLRVPQDISVTGFDGIELADYVIPKITTIRQNTDRFSERSVSILLRCIEEGTGAVHEMIPFELREGESVREVTI